MFTERVGLELEIHEAGLDVAALNVIASPVQDLRMVFDLMPTETPEQWAVIAARHGEGARGARRDPRVAAGRGRRRPRVGAAPGQQGRRAVRDLGRAWRQTGVLHRARRRRVAGVDALRTTCAGARAAEEAFAEFAGFLRAELAPQAPAKDAVGEDVYRLWSRYFVGATLDLREAYEWGWAEFARIEAEMRAVAEPDQAGRDRWPRPPRCWTPTRATASAAGTSSRRGCRACRDNALESLRGKHFDIPDRLMALECRIAPPGGGVGAYYTGAERGLQPAGPDVVVAAAGQDEFSTWRETTHRLPRGRARATTSRSRRR